MLENNEGVLNPRAKVYHLDVLVNLRLSLGVLHLYKLVIITGIKIIDHS